MFNLFCPFEGKVHQDLGAPVATLPPARTQPGLLIPRDEVLATYGHAWASRAVRPPPITVAVAGSVANQSQIKLPYLVQLQRRLSRCHRHRS